ncbi:TPA: hypothetical protein DEA21_05775 [Candidatus Uhrbacteria bacterium]|nr:hypothetical protein [Candidatus Uhrbacteria bacterium]HCU31117.1 hypothetical protein [Candidatus Uhrbacteria bacterium]
MTQTELLAIFQHLRQIDDPEKHDAFWHNLLQLPEEIEIELEANGFVIRRGRYGIRLHQPCGFIAIDIFDKNTSQPKAIDRTRQLTAWELLNDTLTKLRAEKVTNDSIDPPTVAPYK